MKKTNYPATLLCDFYKLAHKDQYPEGTEYVYSTWTPRKSLIKGIDKVVVFGMQAFVQGYLIDYFNEHFFSRPKEDVVAEYVRFIKHAFFVPNPDASHIADLHDLGYLPLHIKAIKEGTLVPMRVPTATVVNTNPKFFWLTNNIETLMSSENWIPLTSATIAFEYRKILTKYAKLTGSDMSLIDWQAHDFSMRGMSIESGKLSGAGHLLSFTGTDTIPAIYFHEEFYNANMETELIGSSVYATEHSVMCAGGQEDEYETYNRLMTKVHPKGILSIVSDTWDLWHVLTNIIPRLKETILKRDGKIVIRPDSGDPQKIICGDPLATDINVQKGVIQLLWECFGGTINEKGYKVLDPHIGAIYGDSITLERCEAICKNLMENGFATSNIVFGIGSFTYQYNTRDTFGNAMKAVHVVINGVEKNILKDPVTDSGTKKSATGRVVVIKLGGEIFLQDGLTIAQQESFANIDLLEDVFVDGKLVRDQSLSEIRQILKEQLDK
jgi:nicotinamide phosphoribosyltransferase